jgi:hypothetical protein
MGVKIDLLGSNIRLVEKYLQTKNIRQEKCMKMTPPEIEQVSRLTKPTHSRYTITQNG